MNTYSELSKLNVRRTNHARKHEPELKPDSELETQSEKRRTSKVSEETI